MATSLAQPSSLCDAGDTLDTQTSPCRCDRGRPARIVAAALVVMGAAPELRDSGRGGSSKPVARPSPHARKALCSDTPCKAFSCGALCPKGGDRPGSAWDSPAACIRNVEEGDVANTPTLMR